MGDRLRAWWWIATHPARAWAVRRWVSDRYETVECPRCDQWVRVTWRREQRRFRRHLYEPHRRWHDYPELVRCPMSSKEVPDA